MKQTDKQRLEELERRVRDLEAQPRMYPVYVPYYVGPPQPVYVPPPVYQPTWYQAPHWYCGQSTTTAEITVS